jgi:hypothetical protein
LETSRAASRIPQTIMTSDPSAQGGVSFVVPVYNKARFLPAVLAAMHAQRGNFARQFVFVDDGSTDGSLKVLRDLTADWRDTVIESQPNAGSAGATNRGIALARHAFIKFVDADDLLIPDATALLLRVLKDSDACLAYGDRAEYTDPAAVDLASPLPDNPAVTRLERPLRAAIRNSLFNPTQFLARTEAVRAAGGCDERIRHSQEYSLTLRLAEMCDFLHVAATVAHVAVNAPGRLSAAKNRQLQRVTLACASYLRDRPDAPAEIRRFACRRAAGRAWHFARRHLGAGPGSEWFWRNLAGRLGVTGDAASFIDRCAAVYDGEAAGDGAAPSGAQ